MTRFLRSFCSFALACGLLVQPALLAATGPVADPPAFFPRPLRLSGLRILESPGDALLARLWLVETAREEINAMSFIWHFDETGFMFLDALLRAAERGVKVRILLDDFAMNEDEIAPLLAMDMIPNCDIRIFNPIVSVNVSLLDALANFLFSFDDFNRRMHNKTWITDGGAWALTGGRNIGNEYFDNSPGMCFHDRDILVREGVARDIAANFQRFWDNRQSRPLTHLLDRRVERMSPTRQQALLDMVRLRAADARKRMHTAFRPEELAEGIRPIRASLRWVEASFVSDPPRKQVGPGMESPGTTGVLNWFVRQARQRITIQSPYFVLHRDALSLFNERRQQVQIFVSTNSLANTDNILAFSGYSRQRIPLLKAGFHLREFKPHPEIFAHRRPAEKWTLHAKNIVIDGRAAFVGTFNIDPRSAYLNTEDGILFYDPVLVGELEAQIKLEMSGPNSWNPAVDDPDSHAGWFTRLKHRFYQLLPIVPYL